MTSTTAQIIFCLRRHERRRGSPLTNCYISDEEWRDIVVENAFDFRIDLYGARVIIAGVPIFRLSALERCNRGVR